ncbi:hypothetical protein ACIOJE_07790 [Kitasatospora sp. NPDC087861]|uniref:hypothetical protein n=1 Tax=Kitasatospora sp. NPDC087861 TaxID=3364070 RepID=UPI0038054091
MNLREKVEEIIKDYDEAQEGWQKTLRAELATYDPEIEGQECEDWEMDRYNELDTEHAFSRSADLDVVIDELRYWLMQNKPEAGCSANA